MRPSEKRFNDWLETSVNKIHAMQAEQKRVRDALDLHSTVDPIDARLRAIIHRNQRPRIVGHGMAGGLELFANLFSPEHAKAKAAEKLLHLRRAERYYVMTKGKSMGSATYARMLNAAACRRRAASRPPSNITIIGA